MYGFFNRFRRVYDATADVCYRLYTTIGDMKNGVAAGAVYFGAWNFFGLLLGDAICKDIPSSCKNDWVDVGLRIPKNFWGGAVTGAFVGTFGSCIRYSAGNNYRPDVCAYASAAVTFVLPSVAYNVGNIIIGPPDDCLLQNLLGNSVLALGSVVLYQGAKYIYIYRHQRANAEVIEEVAGEGVAGEEVAREGVAREGVAREEVAVVETLRERLVACDPQGDIPPDYCDATQLVLMNDPVMLHCGDNFDLEFLPVIKNNCADCPKCRAPLRDGDFIDPRRNTYLRSKIIEFVEERERQHYTRSLEGQPNPQEEKIEEPRSAVVVEVEEVEEKVAAIQPLLMRELTNMEKLEKLNISLNLVNKIFICPLTHEMIDEPVRAGDHGVYEKSALLRHIDECQKDSKPILSPLTDKPLQPLSNGEMFYPANDIRILIERFFAEKKRQLSEGVSFFSRVRAHFNRQSNNSHHVEMGYQGMRADHN